MASPTDLRRSISSVIAAAALVALAAPVAAVTIPEGGVVPPGRVFVINLRVTEGCAGLPMDELEVTIPESVTAVLPEAVGGWTVETELRDGSPQDPQIGVVRWTGGSVGTGEYLDFGLRARFPDEPGATIEFPTIKRCGELTVEWVGSEGDTPAPTVNLGQRLGPRDLRDLSDALSDVEADVEALMAQLEGVAPRNLRARVGDLEARANDIESRLDDLEERLESLEG